ncbi:metallophosphoesterase [Salinibacter ruber]|nr:metallophosphoesterase [Salinibacter ruber]
MPNHFSWLHLSDLHYGQERQDYLWPSLREVFLDDLSALHEKSGPWDAVFFTGDLVQSGETEQFKKLENKVIGPLWERLYELGSEDAALLSVPGNHDLSRPEHESAALNMLLRPDYFRVFKEDFWKPDSDYLEEISSIFNSYTEWWKKTAYRPSEINTGMLPGDFSVTLETNRRRVGVIGLNTTFLQIQSGGYKGKLEWNSRQLHAVCEDGVDNWINYHDICLLLTHHGPSWLSEEARDHGKTEITPAGRFAAHLFGHQHATDLNYVENIGGSNAVRQIQGCSVFGMEKYGNPPEEQRTHGYQAGRIAFQNEDDKATLRLWPRIATDKPDGWRFIPDQQHAKLENDQGTEPEHVAASLRSLPPASSKPEVQTAEQELSSESTSSTESPASPASTHLYGRADLLDETAEMLKEKPFLVLYGMRGNGKSEVIEELSKREPLAKRVSLRIVVTESTTAKELFRQIASALGDRSENPDPPQGTPDDIADEILQRIENPKSTWVWIDRGHKLLDKNGFRRPDVQKLILGLHRALGNRWKWVLELRERPPEGLLSGISNEYEVPGIDRKSLRQCLADAAPPDQQNEWDLSDSIDLKAAFQWLGGGQGAYAHPHATQLLIDVAKARNETPLQVLNRHRRDLQDRMESLLLSDLYNNVLNQSECRMLKALSLYRTGIPHDHIDGLEEQLDLASAWKGLNRRCLLAPNNDHSKYFIHGFVSDWIKSQKIGLNIESEEDEDRFQNDVDSPMRQLVREMHASIATCWLDQLGPDPRISNLNISRALEAFHHLVKAGDAHRVQDIAINLLGDNLKWAREQMERFYKQLYESDAPIEKQIAALEYRAKLEPESHKVQRFLGEAYRQKEGKTSQKALECFERACDLRRNFAPYWSNLGDALLAHGPEAAQDFLDRLDSLEDEHPRVIDDHVRAIQAQCMDLVGRSDDASALRVSEIEDGSQNPAVYNDEAKARLEDDDPEGAMDILDRAEENGVHDEYTTAIRAAALQHIDPEAASELRMNKIENGSQNVVFYNDEAKVRLEDDDPEGAMDILDRAEENGVYDEYTTAIRAAALQHIDPEAATELRMNKIKNGSQNAALYADEARARLDSDDKEGAIDILDLAEENGVDDDHISSLRDY